MAPVEPVVEDADEIMDNADREFEKSLRVLLPIGGAGRGEMQPVRPVNDLPDEIGSVW